MKIKKTSKFFIIILIISILMAIFYRITTPKRNEMIAVLMYHHIVDENEKLDDSLKNSSVIYLNDFKEQMNYLKQNGYITITVTDLYDFLNGDKTFEKNPVLITFDDGYKSNIELAYPILKENGQKASIFIIGSAIEKATLEKEAPDQKLKFMTKDDITKTQDVFDFHSHSYDMHKFENNKPKLTISTYEEIFEDFEKQKDIVDSKHFAAPFGGYNSKTRKILKKIGIKTTYTIMPGYVTKWTNPLKIPRFGISQYTSMQEFINIVSGKWRKSYLLLPFQTL